MKDASRLTWSTILESLSFLLVQFSCDSCSALCVSLLFFWEGQALLVAGSLASNVQERKYLNSTHSLHDSFAFIRNVATNVTTWVAGCLPYSCKWRCGGQHLMLDKAFLDCLVLSTLSNASRSPHLNPQLTYSVNLASSPISASCLLGFHGGLPYLFGICGRARDLNSSPHAFMMNLMNHLPSPRNFLISKPIHLQHIDSLIQNVYLYRASDPLGLELQTFLSFHMGAGN